MGTLLGILFGFVVIDVIAAMLSTLWPYIVIGVVVLIGLGLLGTAIGHVRRR